jgi:wyosine [tRNA(Phe)-imidazoG37] synthetase (radical SAM superfamily)
VADKQVKHIFGPVPSRRLGRSLGVDIIDFKVCTLDCIYCQVGRTTKLTTERAEYIDIEKVLAELKEVLSKGVKADYVTISGSGEPTLHSRLGELVEEIKKLTDIPVAIITNGTLLYRADVRKDCSKADLVVPSLDAAYEELFKKVNRPCEGLTVENLIDGLIKFRQEYAGQIWLEILFVEGVNTGDEHIQRLKEVIKRIKPDKIQLNTSVRPTADQNVRKVRLETLEQISKQLGDNCEVVAGFSAQQSISTSTFSPEDVLSMLKRRPCSLEDICSGLGIGRNEAVKCVSILEGRGAIEKCEKEGLVFYQIALQK